MSRLTGQRGALYLLCWARTPYEAGKRPGHYLGFAWPDTGNADPAILAEIGLALHTRITNRHLTALQAAGVAMRVAQHRAGTGARLTAVIREAGITFEVTRIWAGATERHEKALKDLNNRRKLCPACHPGTTAGIVITPRRFRRNNTRSMRT